MKILLVDDHPLLRKGVIQIITACHSDYMIDEASDGTKALHMMKECDYDLVLLDISLPDMNGLDVLIQIKKHKRPQIVLVMSMLPEENYAVRALKLGASGYLTKGTAPEELVTAIGKVLQGKTYVSATLSDHFVKVLSNGILNGKEPHERLSAREYQIMKLIVSGTKMKDIASSLCLSVKTVSSHRARILKKMDMKGNPELVSYAVKHSLFS